MINTVEGSQSEEGRLLVLTCSLQGRGQTSYCDTLFHVMLTLLMLPVFVCLGFFVCLFFN